MKRIIIISLLAFCVISCNQKNKENPKRGHLKIIKGECNIGNIKSDTIINNFFIIQNTSDQMIYFEDYICCNCIKVTNKKDSLAAGNIDTIKFTFNSRGMKGQVALKEMRIISSAKPELTKLKLKATIL